MSEKLFEGLRMSEDRFIPMAEIDEFLFQEAPKKYPGLSDLRIDMDLIGMRKLAYLSLTQMDRIKELHDQGKIIVAKYPANPTDIYYGCGVIPVDPFFISMAHLIYTRDYSLATEGREQLSPEACAWQAVGNAAIRRDLIPVDVYYTFVGPWCTNSPYNGENLSDVIPEVLFLDHPFFPHLPGKEENAFDYMIKELHNFVHEMERLTQRKISPEILLQSIKIHNNTRRKIRTLMSYLLCDPSPISALDFILSIVLIDDLQSDPVAANDTLDTILTEIDDRARKRVRAKGIQEDAVRIFFSGITTSEITIYNTLEDLGGTLAGLECAWNLFRADVDEHEEPILALAKRDLSIPFTQPMEQRAQVVTDLVRQMKADGSIFDCAFGCNYIAKTAKCVTDNIRAELNIPTVIIDTDLPGENLAALEEHLEGFLEIVREAKESKKVA
jgi:benzoyl-CoA reductase/2-hydroxyglutaryl-CoA dehydratase subunit BcrC/BadD/HgdB